MCTSRSSEEIGGREAGRESVNVPGADVIFLKDFLLLLWMWTILKVFIEFVTVLLLFSVLDF